MFIADPSTHEFAHCECHIKLALDDWALQEALKLRNQVFVHEQAIFNTSDHDVFDSNAQTLVATIGLLGIPDQVIGTVRIHEQAPGVWVGSRLAVDRAHRSVKGLGKALIKMAVSTARDYGCQAFYAHIQLQNVSLFEKLGWSALGLVNIHGLEHMFMQANLARYPRCGNPIDGTVYLFKQPERRSTGEVSG